LGTNNKQNNKNNPITQITIARNKNDIITSDQDWTAMHSANNIKINHSSSSAYETLSSATTRKFDQKIKKKNLGTQNLYEILSQDVNQNHDVTPAPIPITLIIEQIDIDEITPIKPPPPVFVKVVADFLELCQKLIEIIGLDNFVCKSSADKLKIQTSNPD